MAGDDSRLVAAARAGDRAAFATLIERHYALLLGVCRRALGDRESAADAAQEAVVHALLGLERLRDGDRFAAWLAGIGLNVCRRLLQRGRPAAPLDGLALAARDPGPPERAETAWVAERVRAAIAGLPAGQRDAVTLFYLAGLTQAEVADELDTRAGAVKTRLHKARDSLRHALDDVWKEHTMSTTPTAPVPMRIGDLRRTREDGDAAVRHVLFLEEVDGGRRLPIWIGEPEATALAVVLENVELPRPGAYQFAASLLAAAGSGLREVRVNRLTDAVFYAEAVLADGSAIDARPSDALTLALLSDAPILVEQGVLDEAARHQDSLRDDLAAAVDAEDDARTLAEETRARIAAEAAAR